MTRHFTEQSFVFVLEKINIYYYKSNDTDRTFRGMPVVLNLTGSNCFVRCCKKGNKVFLQTEVSHRKNGFSLLDRTYL